MWERERDVISYLTRGLATPKGDGVVVTDEREVLALPAVLTSVR
jgi:hypothetical protein